MVKSTSTLRFETICQIARDLKRQGLRIGFTHGAFDLFHFGHLNFLIEARKRCDFLVVGIDGDANIHKYKSYVRPIIPHQKRLSIINELDCVSAAFVNDWGIEDTWIDLGKDLKAEVLMAGKHYGKGDDRLHREADKIKAKLVRVRHQYEDTTTEIIKQIVRTQHDYKH